MKFSIHGKVYDAADMDLVSLRDILLFEKQVKEFDDDITWEKVGKWAEEIDALKTDAEKLNHPSGIWIPAVMVWASRRIAGEDLTFGEAIDFPMKDLHYITEPQDKKPKANPTKARPGSGRAGAQRAAASADESASLETSEAASIAG
jgi:hypothetical protein